MAIASRPLRLLHEPVLLETGGGIKNAERFLTDETFLVYSGDILTDLPLAPLFEEHFRAGNDVTLALRSTGVASNVAFRDGRVIDIGNRYGHAGNLDYANVSIWNRNAFTRFSSGEKVSFVPVLAEWIGDGGKIGGAVIEDGRWFNLTSPAEYLSVHRTILAEGWRPDYLSPPDWPVRIAPDAIIDPSAEITGCSCYRRRLPDRREGSGRGLDPLARRANCSLRASEKLYRPHPAPRRRHANRRSDLDCEKDEAGTQKCLQARRQTGMGNET